MNAFLEFTDTEVHELFKRSFTDERPDLIFGLVCPVLSQLDLPVEASGQDEMEIGHFLVIERDGTIIGCAALYPSEQPTLGELACLAVHPDYHGEGRGDALLQAIENRALSGGMEKLVVLTTRTAHWFRERGFLPGNQSHLPAGKQALYNYQRKSKVFFKQLG